MASVQNNPNLHTSAVATYSNNPIQSKGKQCRVYLLFSKCKNTLKNTCNRIVEYIIYLFKIIINIFKTKPLSSKSNQTSKKQPDDIIEMLKKEETPYSKLELTNTQSQKIAFIVSTLSKGVITATKNKRDLQKTNLSLRSVHPFKFIGYAYSKHKKDFTTIINMYSFNVVRKEFQKGLAKSLNKRAEKLTRSDHIEGFANEINKDPKKVREVVNRCLKEKEWSPLFEYIIQ